MADYPVRLIAIGLDATPWRLVKKWADAGELPVLASLIREGGTAQLDSLAYDLPESAWPSMVRGHGPAAHGLYNWRGPDPGSYGRLRRPPTRDREPFWTRLHTDATPAGGPPPAILLDLPFTPIEHRDGIVTVAGWGERGGFTNASHPAGELPRLIENHGPYATTLNREAAGRPLVARGQLRTIEKMTARRAQVVQDLMRRHPWQLVVAAFHEVHYAGHAFHVYAEPEAYREIGMPPRFPRGLERSLLRCYQSADRAIGQIIAAAPSGTHVAAFSGMGLRPSTTPVELIEDALVALGYQVPAQASATTRRRQLARTVALRAIPRPLARAIKRRFLDADAVAEQAERVTLESTDWARTRAWGEGEPGFAFVRLNIRGRDEQGLVEPADVDRTRAEITRELLALRVEGTDEPAIEAVVPIEELVGPDPHPALPDLIVRTTRTTTALRVDHPRLGPITRAGREFRVTEHDADGWLVLHGPGISAGSDAGHARIEDVAPTLMQLLGATPPGDLEGRVLDDLLAETSTALPRSSAPRG